MRLNRADLFRVTGTAVGLEWTALRSLLVQYPELLSVLRSAGVFILEACWPLRFDSIDQLRSQPDLVHVQNCLEDIIKGVGQPSQAGARTWLLGELRINLARELASSVRELAGYPVIGFCGYYEGGTDFFGTDGTHIKTEDWDGARRYLVRWCASQSSNSSPLFD